MGRHEKIIEQHDIIKLLYTSVGAIEPFMPTTEAAIRRVAEYVYNREVALKRIINVMAFGNYTSHTHELVAERAIQKIIHIDHRELEKANPDLTFDSFKGKLIATARRSHL